ncbi:MAG: hypothetical protein ACOCV1_06620 [Bacillota bacterium]
MNIYKQLNIQLVQESKNKNNIKIPDWAEPSDNDEIYFSRLVKKNGGKIYVLTERGFLVFSKIETIGYKCMKTQYGYEIISEDIKSNNNKKYIIQANTIHQAKKRAYYLFISLFNLKNSPIEDIECFSLFYYEDEIYFLKNIIEDASTKTKKYLIFPMFLKSSYLRKKDTHRLLEEGERVCIVKRI